jgi:transposase
MIIVYIAKVPVGNYIYLYECEGYRSEGKVKSRRKIVGKIDPKTGFPVYKEEYLERMKAAGTSVQTPPPCEIGDDKLRFSVNDIKNSVVKDIGLTEFLDTLASQSGLREALEISNPMYCDEIFTLAKYLVASGEPFMHCQEWLESVEISESIGNLSSQQISKILADVSTDDIERFHQKWAENRFETEYLAFDITSASSYSEFIDNVEWGYNRDGESLAQANLCMLMGETSRLPVYQTVYQGSLRDVSTLKTIFAKFNSIVHDRPILAVMDKGFFSKNTVDELLATNNKFVMAVPFSNSFAKNQVSDLKNEIDDFSNSVIIGADSLRAVTKMSDWGKKSMYTHVFYNPIKAVIDRERVYKKVAEMIEMVRTEPQKYVGNKEFHRYIDIKQISDGYTLEVKTEAVANASKHAGWLVLISNYITNTVEALQIYRAKDVVEKGFLKMKNSLDLARMRVHSDSTVKSKIFICFVALVLLSHIHTVMDNNNLYKYYTLKQLMRIIAKRRVQVIGNTRIEYPLTKKQKDIYSTFGM